MIKNATRIIAFLLLMLLISTSLISCNGDTSDNTPDTDLPDDGTTDGTAPDDGNTDSGNTDSEGDSGEIDWDNLPMNGLALIYNGKARFQVVYATEAGSTAIREANNFVTRLRELGVDVADPVADTAADSVSDCEIIIGASVRNRSEELTVSICEKAASDIKTILANY